MTPWPGKMGCVSWEVPIFKKAEERKGDACIDPLLGRGRLLLEKFGDGYSS